MDPRERAWWSEAFRRRMPAAGGRLSTERWSTDECRARGAGRGSMRFFGRRADEGAGSVRGSSSSSSPELQLERSERSMPRREPVELRRAAGSWRARAVRQDAKANIGGSQLVGPDSHLHFHTFTLSLFTSGVRCRFFRALRERRSLGLRCLSASQRRRGSI